MGVMIICPHEFDVALCNVKVMNVALSLSLVGHPWCRTAIDIGLFLGELPTP